MTNAVPYPKNPKLKQFVDTPKPIDHAMPVFADVNRRAHRGRTSSGGEFIVWGLYVGTFGWIR
jgi:hypothetical protein